MGGNANGTNNNGGSNMKDIRIEGVVNIYNGKDDDQEYLNIVLEGNIFIEIHIVINFKTQT